MAAGRLPAPGTIYGPCVTDCQHTDCAATRKQAASICHWCGKAIGYETRYYLVSPDGGERRYVHADCEESAIDADRFGR